MVKVTDKFYINADTNQYILQEKVIVQDKNSNNYGQEIFRNIGYYQTLESCLSGILKNELREYICKVDQNSIQDLKEEIKRQTDFIKSLNLNI